MKVAGILTAMALAALTAAPAAAYTAISAVECPDILREDADPTYREMNKWWLMGYITGRNYAADGVVGRGVDNGSIYNMALEYCRENPGSDWDDAAVYIYDALQ